MIDFLGFFGLIHSICLYTPSSFLTFPIFNDFRNVNLKKEDGVYGKKKRSKTVIIYATQKGNIKIYSKKIGMGKNSF